MMKIRGVLIILLIIPIVAGARLPTVGGDEDQWGNVLNEYLNVSHAPGGELKNSSVNSSTLVNGSVTSSKIAAGAIDLASKIVDGIITGVKLVARTITGDLIATNAINNSHIANSAINTSHIEDQTLTGSDIAVDVINSTLITNNSITGDDISTSANLNVQNITTQTLNVTGVADLGLELIQASCGVGPCSVNANCSSGKSVIFAMLSDNGASCVLTSTCSTVCVPGSVTCSLSAGAGTGGVIFMLCGNAI